MKLRRIALLSLMFCVQAAPNLLLRAADPPVPTITNFHIVGTQVNLRFPPYPAAQDYTLLSTEDLTVPVAPNTNFFLASYIISIFTNGATHTTNFGYEWRLIVTNDAAPGGYYKVKITPISSNALLSATVLNRLTYGSTPNDLTNIADIGPQAFIDRQLAPWTLTEDVENTHTNFPVIEDLFVEATNFVWRTNATVEDLRAWHILRAIGAKRQLLEIVLQFVENHFVTQWSKSRNTYFNTYPIGFPCQISHKLCRKLRMYSSECNIIILFNP